MSPRADAISRILKQASAHPEVLDVRSLGSDTYGVTVAVGIPSSMLKHGESNGIREKEVVHFEFPVAFPFKSPIPTLREDFNPELPHINPFKRGERVPPCIVEGSLDELFHTNGILGVIDRLLDWLEDAAKGRLIHPEQGWEPARRDSIESLYIVDPQKLTDDKKGPSYELWSQYVADIPQAGYIARLVEPIPHSPSHVKGVFAHKDPRWSIAIVLHPGPTEVAHYVPDRVDTFEELTRLAETAGSKQQLEQAVNFLKGSVSSPASLERPIVVVVLVRRPFALVSSDSRLEMLGYVWPSKGRAQALSGGLILVAGHRQPCSESLLRRMSGLGQNERRLRWAAVGAGSLGSKVALHAARAGAGPSQVIDREFLEPHNMARHGLTPGRVSCRKAEALASELRGLGGDVTPRDRDVIDLILHAGVRRGKMAFPRRCDFILNTTASSGVREALAAAHSQSGVRRVIEASLVAKGRVGILSVEGSDRNPSTSDLFAWSYVQLRGDAETAAVVFGDAREAGGRLLIGQGCGSTTIAMTDATLSGQAALMGERILELTTELPSTGEVRISEWLPGGNGARVKTFSVRAFEVLSSGATYVRVSAEVVESIRNTSLASVHEVGGVLMGRYSASGNTFHIVDLIAAPSDSVGTANRFVLGTAGLQTTIDAYQESVQGGLYCVGTWHSHPNGPEPSGIDESTRQKMRAHSPNLPMVMLIWSPKGWSVLRID